MLTSGDLQAVGTAISAVTLFGGGFIAYLLRRRGASGHVKTSEAAILWQQAQEMRTMLLSEKQHAEDQRDRLIDAQANSVVPALDAMSQTLRQVLVLMQDVISKLDER